MDHVTWLYSVPKSCILQCDTADQSVKLMPKAKNNQGDFNPFLNEYILDVTSLKAFADNKSNVAKMTISLFDRVENTVGKGENANTSIFSFSHCVFQSFFFRVVKSLDCVVELIKIRQWIIH